MQDWEVKDLIVQASEDTGWNSDSKVIILCRLLGEFSRAGKITDQDIRASIQEKVDAELAYSTDLDPDSEVEEDYDAYAASFGI